MRDLWNDDQHVGDFPVNLYEEIETNAYRWGTFDAGLASFVRKVKEFLLFVRSEFKVIAKEIKSRLTVGEIWL
jgi:hypothetical protein